MLLHDTQVQNFDDIYGGERDLFLNDVNEVINRRFPSPILDIRNFTVSKIDYCVNVETPYVEEYIDFLSRAFQMTNKGARIDYAEENCLTGSVYVKTASDYNADVNKNYTLNFYNKAACIDGSNEPSILCRAPTSRSWPLTEYRFPRIRNSPGGRIGLRSKALVGTLIGRVCIRSGVRSKTGN